VPQEDLPNTLMDQKRPSEIFLPSRIVGFRELTRRSPLRS